MAVTTNRYALIQWEDYFKDVIHVSKILSPRKPFEDYEEGEYVSAKFQGKIYRARISELNDDRTVLLGKIKNGILKHSFNHDVNSSDADEDNMTVDQQQKKRKRANVLLPLPLSDEEDLNIDDDTDPDYRIPKKKKGDSMRTSSSSSDESEHGTSSKKKKTVKRKGSQPTEKNGRQPTEKNGSQPTEKNGRQPTEKNGSQPTEKTVEDEAKKAKQESSKMKREKGKAMAEASAQMSIDVLPDKKIDELAADVREIKAKQDRLISLIEPLLETIQCKECLKSMYKNSKRSLSRPPLASPMPSPAPKRATSTAVSSSPAPVKTIPPPSPVPAPSCKEKIDEVMNVEVPDMDQEPPQDIQNPLDDTELAFLGSAVCGIRMKKLDIIRCEEMASSAEKLALNLLEFLVTKEDCQGMTMYGHGKKTKAMDPNMRRAIKSHIFNIYKKDLSEEERNTFWMEKVVYKMNDKIRGIRNGRYMTKKN